MIMHPPRLVVAPFDEPGRRRESMCRLGVDETARQQERRARGQEPGPRILAERRIEEDHVEVPSLVRDERPGVPDIRLDGASAQCRARCPQRIDERVVAIDGHCERGATRCRFER